VRRFITTQQVIAAGHTRKELEAVEHAGRLLRVDRSVYVDPRDGPVTQLDYAVARTIASGEVATGLVAGALYELDAVDASLVLVPRRRRAVMFGGEPQAVNGILVASGLQVIVELAALLDDLRWEQALESGLCKGLFAIADLEHLLPELSASRTHGAPRIRRVLRLRPKGAPPTESLMETLMIQIARRTEGVPEPERQVVVFDGDRFVARVDVAWQQLGGFGELDGQGHKGQPEYDASRQTDVVATTGWLPARFVWREVRYNPKATGARLVRFVEQMRRRSVA
jgi:hypothetical protein